MNRVELSGVVTQSTRRDPSGVGWRFYLKPPESPVGAIPICVRSSTTGPARRLEFGAQVRVTGFLSPRIRQSGGGLATVVEVTAIRVELTA